MPKRVSFVLDLRADVSVLVDSAVESSHWERRHLLCFSETTSCSSAPVSISFQPRRNLSPLHILAFCPFLTVPSLTLRKQTDRCLIFYHLQSSTHPQGSIFLPIHVHAQSLWHWGFSTWQVNIDRQRFPVYDDWEGWRLITGNCLIVWRGIVRMLICVFPSKWVNETKEKGFYKVLDNCRPPTPNAMA